MAQDQNHDLVCAMDLFHSGITMITYMNAPLLPSLGVTLCRRLLRNMSTILLLPLTSASRADPITGDPNGLEAAWNVSRCGVIGAVATIRAVPNCLSTAAVRPGVEVGESTSPALLKSHRWDFIDAGTVLIGLRGGTGGAKRKRLFSDKLVPEECEGVAPFTACCDGDVFMMFGSTAIRGWLGIDGLRVEVPKRNSRSASSSSCVCACSRTCPVWGNCGTLGRESSISECGSSLATLAASHAFQSIEPADEFTRWPRPVWRYATGGSAEVLTPQRLGGLRSSLGTRSSVWQE